MHIATGQEQTTLRDKILMSAETSCHFGHLLQVKKNFFEVRFFYNVFHNFIHVYSPGVGPDRHRGQKFEVNRNILSLRSFVTSFKKISLKSDFIHFFHAFIHVYSPKGRG